MHFMSIEVAAQKFLFPPSGPGLGLNELDGLVKARERGMGMAPTDIPFSHNHLHDLESLWWVAVWVVFYNYFSEGTSSRDLPSFTLKDVVGQLKLTRVLFPHALNDTDRRDAFQYSGSFQEACKQLPGNKTAISTRLDVLRQFLIGQYKVIEAEYPVSVDPNSSNDDVYEGFIRLFSASKTDCHGLEMDYIPGIFAKLSKEENLKRARSKSTTDGGVARKNPRK
jgi:hypothetical protein